MSETDYQSMADALRDPPVETNDLIEKAKAKFKRSGKRAGGVFAETVPILSYEQNGSVRRFEFWTFDGSNVVKNGERGKAVDLGKAVPIIVIINGKAYQTFEVDGDHGVGIKINMSDLLGSLTTTAEEAWAYLESSKLARTFTEDVTGRQRIMYLIVGFLIGQFIFWFFGI